ncbi:hypothetical protein [Pontibacillus marinus]|uniref:Uncharacterized protein n=1 Tax=Pontibacillus marinus BH030004 = DSM 16465 TaxID=1385511 RepID=A0A0A5GEZ6_9BACI|nr:hypothetical protein [Pontibacillus marinus]KGX89695.1 hypothetical protein N783_04755 [Pontibacillus marinus BH030004 = DSM 16465]
MKKVLVSILVILLLAGGSSFLVNGNNSNLYQAGDMVVEPNSDEEDYPRV